jgi:hypothetical protein
MNSESVPSRAVAKKSTTKRPDSITDRLQEQQQQAYPAVAEKSQQPQGHIEVTGCMSCCFCLQLETVCTSPDIPTPYLLWFTCHLHNYHVSNCNLHVFLHKVSCL